jgi:hypothetical protein
MPVDMSRWTDVSAASCASQYPTPAHKAPTGLTTHLHTMVVALFRTSIRLDELRALVSRQSEMIARLSNR